MDKIKEKLKFLLKPSKPKLAIFFILSAIAILNLLLFNSSFAVPTWLEFILGILFFPLWTPPVLLLILIYAPLEAIARGVGINLETLLPEPLALVVVFITVFAYIYLLACLISTLIDWLQRHNSSRKGTR